jgi:FAS-associated factor 1
MVPKCRQLLKGWPSSSATQAQNENTSLISMKLPQENVLELTDLTGEGVTDDDIFAVPNEVTTYQLRIKYTNEDRYLNLNFPATKTILDIKSDLYAVLKVPVRFQQWTGWPTNASDTAKLSEIGIEPIHNLELTRIESNSGSGSGGHSSRFNM